MDILAKIKVRVLTVSEYIDIRRSTVRGMLRFFQEEIDELERMGLSRRQQAELFSNALRRTIKHSTYLKAFNSIRGSRPEIKAVAEKKEEAAMESQSPLQSHVAIDLPTRNRKKEGFEKADLTGLK